MTVVDANPERYVPWGDDPDSPYRPPEKWVRRFLTRNNLKYRSSMHINGARARVNKEEVELWFEDVRQILFSDPELVEAMADPSRVWNWVSVDTLSSFYRSNIFEFIRMRPVSAQEWSTSWCWPLSATSSPYTTGEETADNTPPSL